MSSKEKKSKKNRINSPLRLLMSTGLITWLFLKIDWQQLAIVLKESSLLYIFFALLAIHLTVLLSVWKWQLLVYASIGEQDKKQINFRKLGRLYYIGLFFNNFLPSSVGGDVVRIYQLGREIGMSKSATSVAFERLTSGGALVVILIGSAIFSKSVRPFLNSIIIFCVLFLFFVLFLWYLMKKNDSKIDNNNCKSGLENTFKTKIMRQMKKVFLNIGQTIGDYRNQHWKWWCWVAVLSAAFQIGLVWINDLLFIALHMDVPFLELMVLITLISALTMLPISINGLGVREVSYVYFFQKLGVSEEIAVSVSLLFFILVLFSSLAGGLFWIRDRRCEHEALRKSLD